MGVDPGEENKQDGSERVDTGGAATTTAGVVRVRNKQIQPGPLRKVPDPIFRNWEGLSAGRRMHWLSSLGLQMLHRRLELGVRKGASPCR